MRINVKVDVSTKVKVIGDTVVRAFTLEDGRLAKIVADVKEKLAKVKRKP